MATKRLLIAAPLVLVAFLLQSWLWVPSYARQTRGKSASAAVTNNMRHHTSCVAVSVISLPKMAVKPQSTTQTWSWNNARECGVIGLDRRRNGRRIV